MARWRRHLPLWVYATMSSDSSRLFGSWFFTWIEFSKRCVVLPGLQTIDNTTDIMVDASTKTTQRVKKQPLHGIQKQKKIAVTWPHVL